MSFLRLRKRSSVPEHARSEVIVYADSDGVLKQVAGDGTVSDLGGNGGSQPGSFQSADLFFTETAGAGTYTATLDVEAGTVVLDVFFYPLAAWAADTVAMDIGDTLHGSKSYIDNLTVNGFSDYTPVAYSIGSNGSNLQKEGNSYSNDGYGVVTTNPNSGIGVRYESSDTLVAVITTTGAGGTTGRFLVKVVYFTPATVTDAVKS